jgi:hypothetical protein
MASTNQGPRRIGQWLYLRPECIDAYKKCHAAVWPEVLEQIKDSNIKDCTSPLHPSLSTPLAFTRTSTVRTDNCRLHLPHPLAAANTLRELQVHRHRLRRGYEAHGTESKGPGVVAHDRRHAGESCRGRGRVQGRAGVVGADGGSVLCGVTGSG